MKLFVIVFIATFLKFATETFAILVLSFNTDTVMYNDPKWSYTLKKSCSKCCKIFKVCELFGLLYIKGF